MMSAVGVKIPLTYFTNPILYCGACAEQTIESKVGGVLGTMDYTEKNNNSVVV